VLFVLIEAAWKRPLAAIAAAWVFGTAAGGWLPAGTLSWKAAALAAAMAVLAVLLAVPGRRYIGWLLVAVAAAAYYQGYDARNVSMISPEQAAAVSTEAFTAPGADDAGEWEAVASGTIVSPVSVDGDNASFTLLVSRIGTAADMAPVSEKVRVSVRLLEQPEQQVAARWGRGDKVTVSGTMKRPQTARNFGGFDYRLYLYRQHIHWLLSVKGAESVRIGAEAAEGEGRASGIAGFDVAALAEQALRVNDHMRQRLGAVFDRLFPDADDSGYMKSLVIGLTDDMDPDIYRQFSQLGLTHMLAISGLHVAVFAAGSMWLLRLFGLTREKMLVVTMLLIPLYVALTGGSPSAVRAGMMAMLGLYAARRRLWKDALNIIGLVAMLMLVWDPYYLYNVSFQLSFLVTLGLIVGVQRFNELLPLRSTALKSTISVTLVAQLVSFPVTVYYFNSVSLLSAIANLLLVPFVSFVVLPLGTFALLAGLISAHAGGLIARVVDLMNEATFRLVRFGAEHDPLRLIWPKPQLWWVVLFYVAIGAVYAGVVRWKRDGRPVAAYVSVAALMLLLAYGHDPDVFDRNGKVQFLDVGQGDAILIRTPHGRHVLIDGGGTVSFRKAGEEWKERRDPFEVGKKLLVPLLMQRGVHRIDWLVVTHQDQDHIGGLQAVVEQIPVGTVVMNGTWKGNEASRKLFETAMRRGADIVTMPRQRIIPIDAETEWTVWTPGTDGEPVRLAEEQNNESVMLLLRMRGTRFLFTGDMEAEQEEDILASLTRDQPVAVSPLPDKSSASGRSPASLVPIDVLKVAHHGSKTSTTDAWLNFWKPRAAVISVGAKNVYGHPNPGVLKRLQDHGVEVHRTDRDGEIDFIVGKEAVKVKRKL
jgi:competence protein ComEC